MYTLFKFFMRKELLVHIACFMLAALWIGFCKILGTSDDIFLARLLPIWAICAVIFPAINLSWIKSLPISKNALLVFNSLNFFANAVIAGASIWTIDKIIDHLFMIEKIKQTAPAPSPSSDPLDFSVVMTAVTAFIVAISLSFFIPGKISIFSTSPHAGPPSKKQTLITAGKFGAIAFAIILAISGYVNQHLLATLAMVFIPTLFISWSLISVGMPKKQSRAWNLAFVGMGLIGSFFVLVSAYRNLDSKSAGKRTAAVRHLGILSGVKSADYYRYALESDLSSSKISDVIYEFSKENHPFFAKIQKRWLKNHDMGISFNAVVTSKKSGDAMESVLELFDPRSLNESDLHIFLQRFNFVSRNRAMGPKARSYWVPLKLSDEFVIELIRSHKSADVNVGLTYMSFHPKKIFFDALLTRLNNLPEDTISQAQGTLAMFTAREISLIELGKYGADANHFRYREQICDHFKLENLKSTSVANANICMRALSLKEKISHDAAESLPTRPDQWTESRASYAIEEFNRI
jgi:hypothetical protein